MKYDAVLLIAETATALELAETLAKPLAPILAMTSDFAEFCDLTSRPRNLIGLHRVAGRRFVELLRSQEAAPAILERAGTWLAACGQTAIVTSKSPLVQSLQLVWWDEAVRLVADGFAIDIVDAAAALLGAERGPLESLDRVGLESVVAQLPRVKPLLAAGIRGRPHCEGFYVITDDSPTCANAVAQLVLLEAAPARHRPRIAEPVDAAAARRYCRERLLARLTVGAIARLRRDPYASAAEIDLAVVRGLGLCAASGGVLRLADRLGLQCVVESLRELRASCGERFKPPRDLLRCVALGATFHGESAELDATAPLMRCA